MKKKKDGFSKMGTCVKELGIKDIIKTIKEYNQLYI